MRAAKTTKNADDLRVLTVGIIMAVAILLAVDPMTRLYERHLAKRPWMEVELTILPPLFSRPRINYVKNASMPLSGFWSGYLEIQHADDAGFERGCGGSGRGNYSKGLSGKPWKWDDWFGADCDVPGRPFRVCVVYALTAPLGTKDTVGPYCSEPYRNHIRG